MPNAMLAERMEAATAEIVSLWQQAADEEPWILLPDHDRIDFLPAVIERVAAAALGPVSDRTCLRSLIAAGAKHGDDRRRQGITDTVLLGETHLLRRAIWSWIRGQELEPAEETTAIMRLDVMMSLAMRASLLGYHREQLDARGKWPAALERLVDEAPIR